ncbi:helix-turn-helix domain-containing protein [Candidatus Nomurabacteria bacterium]|nr:helix-turn-helix domain-containing protein [Candidatus Nomurabacteria bacterium]
MSKYNERIKALSMRREGASIIVIARKLSVSKSTVSEWCREIILTEEQFEKLRINKGISLTTGQRMGAEKNKKKRLDAIVAAEVWGRELIKSISQRELLLIATALYWSEGSKSDRTSGFIFVNSDPEMILVMKSFLVNILMIPPEEIICSIQINRIHEIRIDIVLNFWQKLLSLPGNQFRKPYYVNTRVNKIYDNYENYYGICRLVVRKGMNWKYRMLGLIKAVKSNILSV